MNCGLFWRGFFALKLATLISILIPYFANSFQVTQQLIQFGYQMVSAKILDDC